MNEDSPARAALAQAIAERNAAEVALAEAQRHAAAGKKALEAATAQAALASAAQRADTAATVEQLADMIRAGEDAMLVPPPEPQEFIDARRREELARLASEALDAAAIEANSRLVEARRAARVAGIAVMAEQSTVWAERLIAARREVEALEASLVGLARLPIGADGKPFAASASVAYMPPRQYPLGRAPADVGLGRAVAWLAALGADSSARWEDAQEPPAAPIGVPANFTVLARVAA